MFWLIIGVMLVVGVLVIAVPLYRAEKRLSLTAIMSIVVVTAVSGALYTQIGTPIAISVAQNEAATDIDEMVASLAARLQGNPNDLPGWKMLGRSYLQMGNYPGAITAFEKAVAMESGENGQTLADLGEAVLLSDARTMNGRAGQLFENALALVPGNAKALFYSGLAAVERGDNELGAARWEALLATSPPPNIADILQQRIAELRGDGPQVPVEIPAEGPAAVVNVSVSLGVTASTAELPDATVFVIARDPDQPSPPIAAVRRRLSELPTQIPIADSDAMIPGRVPSGFANLEIIARVSLSGQPIAQPGDWFGQQTINTASTNAAQITIDQQVP